jgi:hypothetical protein
MPVIADVAALCVSPTTLGTITVGAVFVSMKLTVSGPGAFSTTL